jgi:23S rRNA-/tRNA-specific pseudouridylate synthase
MAVADEADGRAAHTSWQVRERLHHATLVEARIYTGRTHQIRVHFQHLGHPVAGDDTYGARPTRRLVEQTGYTPPRVLLHAHTLAFLHPRTRRRRLFTAPWPRDFQQALEALRPPA